MGLDLKIIIKILTISCYRRYAIRICRVTVRNHVWIGDRLNQFARGPLHSDRFAVQARGNRQKCAFKIDGHFLQNNIRYTAHGCFSSKRHFNDAQKIA